MQSLSEYFTRLASADPTPGGGSAATIVAASGAALVAMVARINASNPKRASDHQLARELAAKADALRGALEVARVRDEAAFAAVVAAQAMPKNDEAEREARRRALELALAHAAQEPLQGARLALEVLALANRSLDIPNRNLASDLGCAAEFAAAAVAACAYNVRINHRFMHDEATIAQQRNDLARYERSARAQVQAVRNAVSALVGSA